MAMCPWAHKAQNGQRLTSDGSSPVLTCTPLSHSPWQCRMGANENKSAPHFLNLLPPTSFSSLRQPQLFSIIFCHANWKPYAISWQLAIWKVKGYTASVTANIELNKTVFWITISKNFLQLHVSYHSKCNRGCLHTKRDPGGSIPT